ncbi:type II toxin-antitoxin system Phd/YefM family antitoxin [Candidatus Albibeggiatoa sp. nov. BB20]|uniref:type II toxin-antitoxin system Phd/YefM family antitoxin n=1 Tax=Candidatus Albibeggiatoa sp. nov. BB20 TaxID=3162723 RepID=UPI0033659FA8
MQVVSLAQAQQNLNELCEQVYKTNTPCLIERETQPAVLLSQQEYDALMETFYLLSNPNNANKLLHSLKQARTGNIQEKELLEE